MTGEEDTTMDAERPEFEVQTEANRQIDTVQPIHEQTRSVDRHAEAVHRGSSWPGRVVWGRWWSVVNEKVNWRNASDSRIHYAISRMVPPLTHDEQRLLDSLLQDHDEQ